MEANRQKNPRVLIVEDDPGHQRLLELYLKRAGCDCDISSDGKKGIQQATSSHYDLIFVDINIPEIDGFMVATLLRDQGIEIPLIAVTALELEGIRRKASAVGYNDFLRKPFGQAEIEAVLNKYFLNHSRN
ncbi:MAG: response regulator [Phycisphaerae bacterium]|nr:response regulator [Phycisphaerae bacterium]